MSYKYYDTIFPEKSDPIFWENPINNNNSLFYQNFQNEVKKSEDSLILEKKKKSFMPKFKSKL